MTISEFAAAGGVGVETVRYYQRRGLLETPERPASGTESGGVRRYGEEALRRLCFVRSAQSAGFTLRQIGELLGLDASRDRARIHALARERIGALDSEIAELSRARAALATLADECAGAGPEPCPIVMAFERG